VTVRRTESQIPGGIANISRLSDYVDIQGPVALVSYLPSPIKYISSKRELAQNTYVVMYDTPPQTDIKYTWRFKLYLLGESDSNPFYKIELPEGSEGVFELDYKKTEKAWCIHNAVKLTVEVELSTGETLSLSQQIIKAPKDVDHLERQNVNPNPSAGRPFITKLIEASLADYLDKLEDLDPVVGTQGNQLKSKVISAIIYNTYIQFFSGQALTKYGMMRNGVAWFEYLNRERAQQNWLTQLTAMSAEGYESVGVCGIRPDVLAMLINSSYVAGMPTLTPFTKRPDEDQITYNSEIIGNIGQIIEGTSSGSPDVGVDIFNLLRFPKSCIEICGLLLEEIKNTRNEWKNRHWDSLVSERDGQLMMLLEDFFYGPSDFSKSRMKVSADIVKRLRSAYVSMLSSNKLCLRMRSDFYVGIPDGNSLTNSFLDLFVRANQVDVDISTTLTMLHMTDLEEQYDVAGKRWPIYYGGYEREFELTFIYDFGDTKKVFKFTFELDEFIVIPDYLMNPGNNPRTRLKPIRKKAHDLNLEAIGLDAQIQLLSEGDPGLQELRRQFGEVQDKLYTLGCEFVLLIMHTRRAHRLPNFHVVYQKISVDDQGDEHTDNSSNDYEQALDSLNTQITIFYNAAVSTYCATWQSEELVKVLSGQVEEIRTAKQFFNSIANSWATAEQFTTGIFAGHRLNCTSIIAEPIHIPRVIPKDQYARIPRAIDDDDLFFRINKEILFNPDRPSTSDMTAGAAAVDSVLVSVEEKETMELVFDEFFSDIGRSAVPVKMIIIGYADKTFTGGASNRETYNKDLSERRAKWTEARFLEHVNLRNGEIDAGTADPDRQTKVEIGAGKKLEEIVVSWCGDKHAPGDPSDPQNTLRNDAHTNVRVVLMAAKDVPAAPGFCYQ
jgi:hypothetical protein